MISGSNKATRAAQLQIKSNRLRELALSIIYQAQSGHPGSSFSISEILTVLFYQVMRHDPKNPSWVDRDRFILSKGHAAPMLYSILSDLGYFPEVELATFRQVGSLLQGHPCRTRTPGVETSGSLGQGLSVGCGLAYAAKLLDNRDYKVYVLMGDGEIGEGQIWEAALFAQHYKLDNLIAIIDRNSLQYTGDTEHVMALEPLALKWQAFGWKVDEVMNGHDTSLLMESFEQLADQVGKPKLVIAHTIKGKGVSFMEGDNAWHGTAPNEKQYLAAKQELEEQTRQLERLSDAE